MHDTSRYLRLTVSAKAIATLVLSAVVGLGQLHSQAFAQDIDPQAEFADDADPREEFADDADPQQKTLDLYFGGGQFKVDDEDPQRGLPTEAERNANPLDFGYFLQQLIEKGDMAIQRGDHEAAVKYYLALARATPEAGATFRKLCVAYEALGQLESAQKSCAAVLDRADVVAGDYARYVQLVLTQPGPLSSEQRENLEAVVAHLKQQSPAAELAAELECQVGMRLQDKARLSSCTSALQKLGVKGARLVPYEWSLAMLNGRYDDAARQLVRASETDINPAALEGMKQVTLDKQQPWRPYLRRLSPVSTISMLAALLVAAVGFGLRWRRRAHA